MTNSHGIIIRKHYSEKNNSANYHLHSNPGHEIYLLLQGDVSFSIDGQIYKVNPYDIILISNQEIHKVIANSNVPHERLYIYFNPSYFSQFSNPEYNILKAFEERKLGFGNIIDHEIVIQNNLHSLMEDIYKCYHSQVPEKEAMIISLLIQLLIKINSIYLYNEEFKDITKKDFNYNGKLYSILNYISCNLDKKITLEELENKFFINKYYLCHLFKNITGFTVLEYINYQKISAAKELLRQGTPINDIWTKLGFKDYSSFYRTFKKSTDVSPKQYLASYLEKRKEKEEKNASNNDN